MPVYEINDLKPRIGDGTWIAPSADIIGDVTIGKNCYIGFGAVIRADFGPIIIGSESLIEDNVVVHTATLTEIGNRVIVGHMAMIHDAVIRDRALIGMKAMICEGAVIGADAIVAEQALVRKNQEIPPAKIYGGAPAEFIKEATKKHQEMLGEGIAAYMDLLRLYEKSFKKL